MTVFVQLSFPPLARGTTWSKEAVVCDVCDVCDVCVMCVCVCVCVMCV